MNFHHVAAVAQGTKFKKVFDNKLDELPGITLELKPGAICVVMANQRLTVSVHPQLKQELQRFTKLGIIKPVEKPTTWVSQLVLTKKKNGSLRICLELHELNKALMWEHYTIPMLEDVLCDMKDAKIFTKANLSSGYWHVKLNEASRDLATFQNCFAYFHWWQLPFGMNSSAEIL